MLQIIGWLGCFYLGIKLMEIAANRNYRDDAGKLTEGAFATLVTGWVGVAVFAALFYFQGQEIAS